MLRQAVEARPRTFSPLVEQLAHADRLDESLDILLRLHASYCHTTDKAIRALIEGAARAAQRGLHPTPQDLVQRLFMTLRSSASEIDENSVEALRNWFSADSTARWNVNSATINVHGVCSGCNAPLEPLQLRAEEQAFLVSHLKDMLPKGPQLTAFQHFLTGQGAVDVVIDGMNVGHLLGPVYNPVLLELVLKHFEGKRIIVLIREHVIRSLKKQDSASDVFDRLQKQGQLFSVRDARADDDYFFLYAALTNSLNVDLVSNDQFRDHRNLLGTDTAGEDLRKWQRGHQLRVEAGMHPRTGPYIRMGAKTVHDSVVQQTQTSWHLPLKDGSWLCAVK
eukprot:m.497113 g.497113  ORF g.497113 m.497113 type:complete len:336 (+) comp57311_c0_seq6:849-1856(+)